MPPSRVFATGRCSSTRPCGRRRGSSRPVTRAGVSVITSVLAVFLFAACQPAHGTPPSTTPTPTVTTPTPSPTSTVDLSAPGVARRMLNRLLAAAGPGRPIMVELTTQTASVSVLSADSTEPVTWTYRDHEIQQVASDLQYVDQASFDIDKFALDDVGRLFRIAAALSDETTHQTLQIVDYSGGRVMMAVTTNPESRTVFFNPDGSLLPELDYHTPTGIAAGLADVLAGRVVAREVGIDSEAGAWASYAGPNDTTIRCQRPPKVPVTTVIRDEPPPSEAFAAQQVNAQVIWQVVQQTAFAHDLDPDTPWSVVVDDPNGSGNPQLRFQIGGLSLTTDSSGRELPHS